MGVLSATLTNHNLLYFQDPFMGMNNKIVASDVPDSFLVDIQNWRHICFFSSIIKLVPSRKKVKTDCSLAATMSCFA